MASDLDIIRGHVHFQPPGSSTLGSGAGGEWRGLPEVPTAQELNPASLADEVDDSILEALPHNDVGKPYPTKDQYVKILYQLGREEGITMLRASINEYKGAHDLRDSTLTRVYTKVFIQGYKMSRLGPACEIQFSMERAGKRVRWTHTSRLIPGTLVALSTAKDKFRTICMPAIVADRSKATLESNPPTVQIFWAALQDSLVDPSEELVMIESQKGFFESVRHTLVGLQHCVLTETRFDKYLVHGSHADAVAEHVRENPWMDITSLARQAPSDGLQMTGILYQYPNCNVVDGIPSAIVERSSLDHSQLEAVQRMLTKELTLIQGPPGTGKTFTSVQALKCLARESPVRTMGLGRVVHANWPRNIIVVAAETNHAVDQMLSRLSASQYRVVRLGGRSQDEEIKKHSLFSLRRNATNKHKIDGQLLEQSRIRLVKQFQRMTDEASPGDRLLNPHVLLKHGIITTEQLQSLVDDKSNWVPPRGRPGGVMSEWLDGSLVDIFVRRLPDPVFDTEEIDAGDEEDCPGQSDLDVDDPAFDDDRDVRLSGAWVNISRKWGGANPQGYTEQNLLMRRQLQKQDLWDVDQKFRGAIYEYWCRQLHAVTRNNLYTLLIDYWGVCQDIKVNGWKRDADLIRRTNIQFIGCTTTGLSKYRGLLAALKPTTLLIEEAAQSKEASITASIFPSLQRLILVGDHQQLRPYCDIPALGERPYNMNVSMLERLVAYLKLPYTMLSMQRRAIPTIRELLNPFYPRLQDHPFVMDPENRPAVPGVVAPSYLFHHTWPEATDTECLSKYNLQEAEMIVQFAIHLILNGIPAHKITVLTFYRGQCKQIRRLSSKHRNHPTLAQELTVKTVDSYQGEENDIIILSLVRSNKPGGGYVAGFVKDVCRGVVSISRARCGFYVFGNIVNLENASWDASLMWGNVRQVFQEQGRFDASRCGIPICCSNHGTILYIEDADGFSTLQGGCRSRCEGRFDDCGHHCTGLCHPMSHDKLICPHACERQLDCGHRCVNVCGMDCSCDRQCPQTPDQPAGPRNSRANTLQRALRPNGVPQGRRSIATQNWVDFNAARDDARIRQALQSQRIPEPLDLLIDISEPTSAPNRLRHSYHQVTVDEHGQRHIGDWVDTDWVLPIHSTGPEASTATSSQQNNSATLELVQRQTDRMSLQERLMSHGHTPREPTDGPVPARPEHLGRIFEAVRGDWESSDEETEYLADQPGSGNDSLA